MDRRADRTLCDHGPSYLWLIVACALIGACHPRVKMTAAEHARIPIDGREDLVLMMNGSGELDTLVFRKWDRRDKARFGGWYEKSRGEEPPQRGQRRGHYLTYSFERFPVTGPHVLDTTHLDIWSDVDFTKHGDSEHLLLSMQGFEEQYTLNELTPDTLVFEVRRLPPHSGCGWCEKRILWSPTEGLLAVERTAGSVWRRIMPDRDQAGRR